MAQRSPDSDPANPPGSCSQPLTHALTDGEVATDVDLLKILGNRTRYQALRLIAEADDEVCVCELEPTLDVSQGGVSQALSRLFNAGLVERRKEGRWRYYAPTKTAEQLLHMLDQTRSTVSNEE